MKASEIREMNVAEVRQQLEEREEELAKVLDMQRQTLHDVSGLSNEEATSKLLEMLEQELQHETGAIDAVLVPDEPAQGRHHLRHR